MPDKELKEWVLAVIHTGGEGICFGDVIARLRQKGYKDNKPDFVGRVQKIVRRLILEGSVACQEHQQQGTITRRYSVPQGGDGQAVGESAQKS